MTEVGVVWAGCIRSVSAATLLMFIQQTHTSDLSINQPALFPLILSRHSSVLHPNLSHSITMHTTAITPFLLTVLPLTLALDHQITVGAAGALRFNPETVTAAIGDTLSFTYFPRNHSVVESNFADPCKPLAGGFNSGFVPVAPGAGTGTGAKKFVVTVKNNKPIWVYCAQTTGRHCQSGMSMVVNQA